MGAARRVVLSLVAAGGVAGGTVAGLALTPGHADSPAATDVTTASTATDPGVDTTAARAAVRSLLAEQRSLHKAIGQARHRLHHQIALREAALARTEAQLSRSRAALQQQAPPPVAVQHVAAPPPPAPVAASRPASHTTTGASGAGGGEHEGDGEHEHEGGGGDD